MNILLSSHFRSKIFLVYIFCEIFCYTTEIDDYCKINPCKKGKFHLLYAIMWNVIYALIIFLSPSISPLDIWSILSINLPIEEIKNKNIQWRTSKQDLI